MKTKILILLITLSSSAFAAESQSPLENALTACRPEKVAKVVPGITSKDETIKILGAPQKSKDGLLFFNESGNEYDLTVSIDQGRVKYVYYELTGPQANRDCGNFNQFKDHLTASQKKQAEKSLQENPNEHQRGRFFNVLFQKESVKIEFYNSPEKKIHSILIWKKGDHLK